MSERNDRSSSENLKNALEAKRDPNVQLTGLFDLATTHPIDDNHLVGVQKMAGAYIEQIVETGDSAKIDSANQRLDLMKAQLEGSNARGVEIIDGHATLAANDDNYSTLPDDSGTPAEQLAQIKKINEQAA